ncbi:hypothetical protein [Pigmentiphaga litoralis]
MPNLKSGRSVGITLEPYMDKLRKPSIDYIWATHGYFRLCIKKPSDLLKFASIFQGDDPSFKNPKATGFSVDDLHKGRVSWSKEDLHDFNEWLNSNCDLPPWLNAQFKQAKYIVDPVIFSHPFPSNKDVAITREPVIEDKCQQFQPAAKIANEEIEDKEFRELVVEMRLLGFKHSSQLSEYIVAISLEQNTGIYQGYCKWNKTGLRGVSVVASRPEFMPNYVMS